MEILFNVLLQVASLELVVDHHLQLKVQKENQSKIYQKINMMFDFCQI